MPSPFPGMDPYLEDPQEWPEVHNRFPKIPYLWLICQVEQVVRFGRL